MGVIATFILMVILGILIWLVVLVYQYMYILKLPYTYMKKRKAKKDLKKRVYNELDEMIHRLREQKAQH